MEKITSDLWLDLLGKPYRHLARGPDAYDCYGLLLEVFRRRGIVIRDYTYTRNVPGRVDLMNGVIPTYWRRTEIKPGAALLFHQSGDPAHCGMALDLDRFIHASAGFGQVLVNRLSDQQPAFRRLLVGAYEYKGQDDAV